MFYPQSSPRGKIRPRQRSGCQSAQVDWDDKTATSQERSIGCVTIELQWYVCACFFQVLINDIRLCSISFSFRDRNDDYIPDVLSSPDVSMFFVLQFFVYESDLTVIKKGLIQMISCSSRICTRETRRWMSKTHHLIAPFLSFFFPFIFGNHLSKIYLEFKVVKKSDPNRLCAEVFYFASLVFELKVS